MGKKGTKRKTRWRTLSITDSGDETTETKNGTTTQNNEEVSSVDDNFRHSNSSYLRRKPLLSSSTNVRNDSRGGYSRNYYKQNSTLSSSSSYSSRNSYHRRPFQNNASRFFSYRSGRIGAQNYRTSVTNKENNETKPLFNEDEYTRITTPRQDVIFKKGYLSQPRKNFSSTDTNTTSSAAASIVSTEESISAASVPSLSPEQCSSYAESIEPDQALMYGYFDQNGVFYFNPYLPNGFDQYAGQMFMLPYSYQPYLYPPDLSSPLQSTDAEEEIPTSTDSKENLSDNKETNIKESTEELPNSCDPKPEPPNNEKITVNTEENKENIEEESEHVEITNTPAESFYNYGYQQFYPPIFFPYLYGQQVMPVMGAEYEPYIECSEENVGKHAKHRERHRTRTNTDGSSTGATTADCSEEDCSDIVDDATMEEEASCDTVTDSKIISNQETEQKKVTLSADVEEFIPRNKPHLNVNVKEFLPRNYKPKESIKCLNESETVNSKEEVKENVPLETSIKTQEEEKVISEELKNQNEIASKEKVTNSSLSGKRHEKPPKLTLAERIKNGLFKESTIPEKSAPPKNNSASLVHKKNPKRNENRGAKENNSSISFAQMLSKGKQKIVKTPPVSAAISISNNNNKNYKNPAKNIAKLNVSDPQEVQSQATAEKHVVIQEEEWHTVKPKGKRRHFKETISLVDEIPEKDEVVDNKEIEKIAPESFVEKVAGETFVTEKEETIKSVKGNDIEEVARNKETEIVSTSDRIEDDADKQVILQKKTKIRNKKSKKSQSSTKKTKEKEIVKSLVSEELNEKTDQKLKNNSKPIEIKDLCQTNKSLLITPKNSEEELTLDSLYLLDRKNCLLTKNFCRNPLEMLNGFDCKFKGNNGILKEEEDLVLNVIKSLSTNQAKQQHETTSFSGVIQNDRANHEHAGHEENSNSTDDVKQDEVVCGLEGNLKCEITDQQESNTSEHIFNGNVSDSGCKSDVEKSVDEQEDVEEDTVVQTLPEDIANSLNGRMSVTESLSDLSSDDLERKGELDKNEVVANDLNNSQVGNKVSNEIEEYCQENMSSVDAEKLIMNEIQNSNEVIDTTTEAVVIPHKVPNNMHFNEEKSKETVNSIETYDDKIASNVSQDNNASLLKNSSQMLALNSPNIEDETNNDCNDSNFFHIESLKLFNHEKSSEEKSDIRTIFETKMKEIEDQLKQTSHNISNTRQEEAPLMEASHNEILPEKHFIGENLPEKALPVDVLSLTTIPLEAIPEKVSSREILLVTEVSKEDFPVEKFSVENAIQTCGAREQENNNNNDFEEIFSVFDELQLKQASQSVSNKQQEALQVKTSNNEVFLEKHSIQERRPEEAFPEKVLPEKALPEKVLPVNVVAVPLESIPENALTLPKAELSMETVLVETISVENASQLREEVIRLEKIVPVCEIYEEKNDHDKETALEKLLPMKDLSIKTLPDTFPDESLPDKTGNYGVSENGRDHQNDFDYGNCNSTDICSNTSNCDSKTTNEMSTEDFEESNDLHISCISPINDSGIVSNVSEGTSQQSCSETEHLDYTCTSDYHSSAEIQDSNETFSKNDNSDESDLNSTVILTATSHHLDHPKKYPLTTAIKKWLNNEVKENSPEPIFRIPDDPELSSIITSSIMEQVNVGNECEDWSSDESDDENPDKNSKNLQSNPSHVSSAKLLSQYRNQKFQQNDNDSDYNSDSQQRCDEDDDNTCERVAFMNTSEIFKNYKCDLLDYWDDEFIRDPKRWLAASKYTNQEKESVLSTTPSDQLAPYESVYGKSIDYNRLLASDYEFLSNNIISFNDNNSPNDKKSTRTDVINDTTTTNGTSLNNNNNFGNNNNNINDKNNCLKPPEVCCIIM